MVRGYDLVGDRDVGEHVVVVVFKGELSRCCSKKDGASVGVVSARVVCVKPVD